MVQWTIKNDWVFAGEKNMIGAFLRSVCMLALVVAPAYASVHSIAVSGDLNPAAISPNGDDVDDSASLSLTYSGIWQDQSQGGFAYSWASLAGQPLIYHVALNSFANGV